MLTILQADADLTARVINKNDQHIYHVSLKSDEGGVDRDLSYTIHLKCTDPPTKITSAKLELKVTDYRLAALDEVHRKKVSGAGSLFMSAQGLPELLQANVVDAHIWFPMLCWFLPDAVTNGKFEVKQTLGAGVDFEAKGTLKDGEYKVDGAIGSATVSLTWHLGKAGWLSDGSGDVVTSDGTIHFKINGH